MKFVQPSKLKNFRKYQIFCRNNVLKLSSLLYKHARSKLQGYKQLIRK